ncbi:MAG: transporter substrate-binding domain-containing protein, partial [Peptococcaceae bacterium]|nr:transporter substrate-binding domain-containing protein [Peptococcaceae bacterium]
MKKAIAAALVGFMAMGLLAGCGGGKEDEDNTLRIGMECAYAPFNWTQTDDSNGAVPIESGDYANGYDVQIAKKVAEGLGKELVIVKTEWDGLVPAVDSGVIDGIIAGMSPTEERKKSIDFSENYYVSDLVIVVKADSPYANATSIKDFAGATLTAQLNT